MSGLRYGTIGAPWSNVRTWREANGYRVLLTLACGHQVFRIKRTHRLYRRVQCEDCVKAIPRRPVPPPAPRVTITVVIRPDIRARFRTLLTRVDARLDAEARRAKRVRGEREVQDYFGPIEYSVSHWKAGRIPPGVVSELDLDGRR